MNEFIFQVFNDALYLTLKKALGETQLLTPDMSFAWRAFNFDLTTTNILGTSGGSRPGKIL